MIQLALSLSVMMVVFSLGLQSTIDDASYLLRRPVRFFRSIVSMFVIMPLVAMALVRLLNLPPAVDIAIAVLAVSPVPPILPRKQIGAGGTRHYALGLLVAASLASIVFVPFWVGLFGTMPGRTIALIVTKSIIVPLAAGLLVRRLSTGFADRLAGPLSKLAMILLVVSVVPVIFTQISAAVSLIGDGTLFALVVFVVVGLLAGAALGGPDANDRTVLALSTAARHPGVAIAIATANFPEHTLVLPAIVLYLIVSAIVSGVFLRIRKGPPSSRQAEPQEGRSAA